jgi:uncharacterized damage-inducible protein DinB
MHELTLLKHQYRMIRSSREVVLNFAAQYLTPQLQAPVVGFADRSIAYLLVHNANVYIHWLANFAMQLNVTYFEAAEFWNVESIRALYDNVDQLVDGFINRYEGRLDTIVTGTTISGRTGQSTPLELFTHVVTHEFHHKGQILSMFRQLGHQPPDADVIRF